MKTIAVIDKHGIVHNIGPWVNEIDGVNNPLPEGLQEGEFELRLTAGGKYVLATDYRNLRASEYPSIGAQLDALFKAGVFPAEMANQIAAVKEKYPKT